jgi:hypothetical protein
MLALIQFFVDLALLRRGPQDLPASAALLVLLIGLNFVIGSINGADLFGGFLPALGANLLDVLLTLVLLFALLQLRGHTARLQQTASAFFGLGALAGVLMLAVRLPAELLGLGTQIALIDLVVAIWLHLAFGNILRHALDVPLLAGVIIMLSYTMIAFNLIARVFPPVIAG